MRVRRSVHPGSLVCAPACAIVSPLQPSFLLSCRRASRRSDGGASPGTHLHAAFSSSEREVPARHHCLGQILAPGLLLGREFAVVDRKPSRSRKPERSRPPWRAELRLTRTAFWRRRIDFRDLVKTIGLGIVRPGDERAAHFCAVPSGFDAKSKRLFDRDAARR